MRLNKLTIALAIVSTLGTTSLPLLPLTAATAIATFAMSGEAMACDPNFSSCEEFVRRSSLPSIKGKLAPTEAQMVCFHPLVKEAPTAIVIREGNGIKGRDLGIGFRTQPEVWKPAPHGRFYRETCLTVTFMKEHRNTGFTYCGANGKVYFDPATIDLILRSGRITAEDDPACMFGGTCSFY